MTGLQTLDGGNLDMHDDMHDDRQDPTKNDAHRRPEPIALIYPHAMTDRMTDRTAARDPGWLAQLKRYLGRIDPRRRYLAHPGDFELRDVALQSHVPDVEVSLSHALPPLEAATNVAIGLNAEELELALPRPVVLVSKQGELETLTVAEADSLASETSSAFWIRDALGAACDAVRCGIDRVRLGDPLALHDDRAVTVVREAA